MCVVSPRSPVTVPAARAVLRAALSPTEPGAHALALLSAGAICGAEDCGDTGLHTINAVLADTSGEAGAPAVDLDSDVCVAFVDAIEEECMADAVRDLLETDPAGAAELLRSAVALIVTSASSAWAAPPAAAGAAAGAGAPAGGEEEALEVPRG